ncbi:VOC family protein [Nigerium massiliense]|uniref:VOC family protein n=1 Tax=Nigerium massiliense TaxID=1522317 RepID=UPI00058ED856|nr:VOC family protein [Nigerium massiliense]
MTRLREVQVTIDCADVDAQATFWCEVLGYRLEPPPGEFASWDDALDAWGVPESERHTRSAAVPPEGEPGPRLFFQAVPEPKTAKNRLHLDVRAAPGLRGEERMATLQAESDRLVALGARQVRRVEADDAMEAGFIWMEDPEGNEFCLD